MACLFSATSAACCAANAHTPEFRRWIVCRLLVSEDLVNCAVRERDHEQVAVGPGLNVGADPEVSADEQAFAFSDVEFAKVVGHPVLQPGIVYPDPPAVAGQGEVGQVAAPQERPCGSP